MKLDIVVAGEIIDNDDIVRLGEQSSSDHHAVIASINHSLASKDSVTLGDLEEFEWVMPDTDMLPRRQFESIFEILNMKKPSVLIESRSPSTIKAIVAQTGLLGWLPLPMVAAEISAEQLRNLDVKEFQLQRTFYVYRRRRAFVSPQIYSFVNALQE